MIEYDDRCPPLFFRRTYAKHTQGLRQIWSGCMTLTNDLFAEYPTKVSDGHPRLTNFTNQLEKDDRVRSKTIRSVRGGGIKPSLLPPSCMLLRGPSTSLIF